MKNDREAIEAKILNNKSALKSNVKAIEEHPKINHIIVSPL